MSIDNRTALTRVLTTEPHLLNSRGLKPAKEMVSLVALIHHLISVGCAPSWLRGLIDSLWVLVRMGVSLMVEGQVAIFRTSLPFIIILKQ